MFLLQWSRYQERIRPWLGAMAALVLPYLPFARWEIPLLFSNFQTGHPFYPLGQILTIILQALSLGIAPRPPLRLFSPLQTLGGLFFYEGLVLALFLSLAGLLLYRDRESDPARR